MRDGILITTVILGLLLAVNGANAENGFKLLRLEADRGIDVGENPDPWLTDSTVITGSPTEFTVELLYKWNGAGIHPSGVDGSYFILTTNLDPVLSGIQVTLSNMRYSDVGGTGIPDKTIAPGEWTQFDTGDHGLTFLTYPTADHGILQYPNWYTVVQLDGINDGQYLMDNDANQLLVDISATAADGSTRLHIDSVGSYVDNNGNEIGFVGNPYSKDITWQVPEFPTIALPIAAVIGLVFLFQRKRNKEE